MNQTLEQALKAANIETLTLRLELYADNLLRSKLWRGHFLGTGRNGQLLAGTKSADDFVTEAVQALLHGPRTYRDDLDLETNLRRIIRSRISSWKNTSDREPLLDHVASASEGGEEFDPIESAPDHLASGTSVIEKNERRELQKQLLTDFQSSLEGDEELLQLFEAYESGFEKPAEVEALTGISSDRISELKRKLKMKMIKFKANHPTAAALGE